MDHGIVAEDTESQGALLREASGYAAAVDDERLLLAFLDEGSYESDLETLEPICNVYSASAFVHSASGVN